MSIKAGLFTILSNAALVGTRIYPQYRPRKTALPAITYRLVAATRELTMDGQSRRVDAQFEVGCWAATDAAATALADAVRGVLDGAAWAQWSTVTVQRAAIVNQRDEPEIDPESEQLTAFGVTLTLAVAYEE